MADETQRIDRAMWTLLVAAFVSAALWSDSSLAQQSSVVIEPDWDVPAHGVRYATVDLFEDTCREDDDRLGGVDPLPEEALEVLTRQVERMRGHPIRRCAVAGSLKELFEECFRPEGLEPVKTSAFRALAASEIVVHGTVAEIVPAYDFDIGRPASIVLLDVIQPFPSRSLGGVTRVVFALPEGAFYCRGKLLCSSPNGGPSEAQPTLKTGQEVLVGAWSFNPRDEGLRVLEAMIFIVGPDDVARPMKSREGTYAPPTFLLAEALRSSRSASAPEGLRPR